jgi:hypothetical protein
MGRDIPNVLPQLGALAAPLVVHRPRIADSAVLPHFRLRFSTEQLAPGSSKRPATGIYDLRAVPAPRVTMLGRNYTVA